MSDTPSALVDRLAGLSVVVVGDAMLDVYLEGAAERMCREAPVPVVTLRARTDLPGGAANAAVNVAELGGTVTLASVIGRDEEGDRLVEAVKASGVETGALVRVDRRRTLALHRVIGGSQMIVRFDHGTTDPLDPESEALLVEGLASAVRDADAVILSDYGHGVVSPGVVDTLAERRHPDGPVLVVDSKHPADLRRLRPTAVTPNWTEAVRILGDREVENASDRADAIDAEGRRILELTGSQIAAVTLDSDGAIVFQPDRPPHRTYAPATPSGGATGAGDTFVSALTLALAAGADAPAAAELASAAAAVVVSKERTAPCTASELRARVTGREKYLSGMDELAARAADHRRRGRRIVFTNGCFDLLHRGHVSYLSRARALGDVLVVALNDDAGVRRLKGPGRPINPLEDRSEVLSALSCVDHIVAFSGDRPTDMLRAARPDVYVKGGDYTYDTLPEASLVEELGGTVEILPVVDDRSSSLIIDRVRAADQQARRPS